jgi:hypothetical protein
MKLKIQRSRKTSEKQTYLRTSDVRIGKDFESLFPINKAVRESIATSMRKNGFDENHPLVLWKEENVLLDGHTRLAASKLVGLKQVPVVFSSFPNLEAALKYARSLQFNRRNLMDSDLFAHVLRLDVDGLPGAGRKQERLARLCNISTTRAVRIIKVKKDGTRKQHAEILSGRLSIHAAYTFLVENRVRPVSGNHHRSKAKTVRIQVDEFSRLLAAWLDQHKHYSPGSPIEREVITLLSQLCPDPEHREYLEKILIR